MYLPMYICRCVPPGENQIAVNNNNNNNNNNKYYYYHHHHCLLYAGYPYTYSRDKPCPQAIHCCNYSVFVVYGASISSSCVGSFVLLRQHFPKYVCSAQYGCFCSSLTSCYPGMLLTYFLNDLEMVPVAPVVTGITLVVTFHMRRISIVNSLYFKTFSALF